MPRVIYAKKTTCLTVEPIKPSKLNDKQKKVVEEKQPFYVEEILDMNSELVKIKLSYDRGEWWLMREDWELGGLYDQRFHFFCIDEGVGLGQTNNISDVITVKAKLKELGFLQKDLSVTVTSELSRAIKMFKSIVDSSMGLAHSDIIHPNDRYCEFFNNPECPKWVNFPPAGNAWLSCAEEDGWGSSWVLKILDDIGAKYLLKYLNPKPFLLGGERRGQVLTTGIGFYLLLPSTHSKNAICYSRYSDDFDRETFEQQLSFLNNSEHITDIYFDDNELNKKRLAKRGLGMTTKAFVLTKPLVSD